MSPLLAQVEIRERSDTCVSDNGFCPSWIADNFDRYVDPFFQHVLLTLVPSRSLSLPIATAGS